MSLWAWLIILDARKHMPYPPGVEVRQCSSSAEQEAENGSSDSHCKIVSESIWKVVVCVKIELLRIAT